jgi:hypothetical protein
MKTEHKTIENNKNDGFFVRNFDHSDVPPELKEALRATIGIYLKNKGNATTQQGE